MENQAYVSEYRSLPASPQLARQQLQIRQHPNSCKLERRSQPAAFAPEISHRPLNMKLKICHGMANPAFIMEKQLLTSNRLPPSQQSMEKVKLDDIKSIVRLVRDLKQRIRRCNQSELRILHKLLHSKQYQRAIILQHKVQQCLKGAWPLPVSCSSQQTALDVCNSLESINGMGDSVCPDKALADQENNIKSQLNSILSRPEIQAVLETHDKVAAEIRANPEAKDEEEKSTFDDVTAPRIETIVTESGQELRKITLTKTEDPLGATVKNEGESVVIARIIKGGVADKAKLFKIGDELIKINDIELQGKKIDQVVDIMTPITGTIEFVVRPNLLWNPIVPRQQVTLRAQFNYDAKADGFLPCQELGISFNIGDILHVINRDDPYWWQAYRDGENFDSTLAGLIPSKMFWETVSQIEATIMADADLENNFGCCPTLHMKRKHPKTVLPGDLEVLTYEEVDYLLPDPSVKSRKQPILLVGCDEIKPLEIGSLVVDTDQESFAMPKRISSNEPGGLDEGDHISSKQFLEHVKSGEIMDYSISNQTGIRKKDVLKIIESGAQCIYNCQIQNIAKFRTKEFKPYVIFTAVPHMEKLKLLFTELHGITPSVEECKHVIDLSRSMEANYSHLIDHVVTVTDLTQAKSEIIDVIKTVNSSKQWVPSNWLTNSIDRNPCVNEDEQKSTASKNSPKYFKAAEDKDGGISQSPRLKRLATKQSPLVERVKNTTPTSLRKILPKSSPILSSKRSDSVCKLTNSSSGSLAGEDDAC